MMWAYFQNYLLIIISLKMALTSDQKKRHRTSRL